MYKKSSPTETAIAMNQSVQGETIETKLQRVMNNKEPITDGAPIIYSDRKEGVKPEYNIKTDRWEIAVDAMSNADKGHKARREDRHKPKEDPKKDTDNQNAGTAANPSDKA